MKRKVKAFTILLTILAIISLFVHFSYASTITDLGGLEAYKGSVSNPVQFTNKVGKVLGIIQNIGIVLSVIVLIGIGLRYMRGSVEEKAEYKKTLLPYFLGAVLIFSMSTIPQLIFSFMEQVKIN